MRVVLLTLVALSGIASAFSELASHRNPNTQIRCSSRVGRQCFAPRRSAPTALSPLQVTSMSIALPGAFAEVDAGIVALQTMTRVFAAVFGFGDALLAMPMLAVMFALPPTVAAPLVLMVSIMVMLMNLAVDVSNGQMKECGRVTESAFLFAGAAMGVPFGVHAIVNVSPTVMRAGLGVLLLVYGTSKLIASLQSKSPRVSDHEPLYNPYRKTFGSRVPPFKGEGVTPKVPSGGFEASRPRQRLLGLAMRTIPFGLAAGFLGGAVAQPGPSAVVFGQVQNWCPKTTRTMLSRFFLPVDFVVMMSFLTNGLLTRQVVMQAACAIPGVFAGVCVGTYLNRRFDASNFTSAVTLIIIALGGLSLYSAISPL